MMIFFLSIKLYQILFFFLMILFFLQKVWQLIEESVPQDLNFGDASRYGMGEPITVDSLENLFKTFAKIKAQQSIFKPKEARLSTTRVRPKISIGDPSGKFQVADDLSTAINLKIFFANTKSLLVNLYCTL